MGILKYKGKLHFDIPLNDEELEFLQDWQANLVDVYNEYSEAETKSEKEKISKKFNSYTGIDFDEKQRGTIFFGMNPMIHFHHDCIELKGQSKKGNLREALMAYHHFFLGEDAVLKECLDLSFMKTHNLNGIIESYKDDYKTGESKWCYVVKNNEFSSVDVETIKEYEENPKKWDVTVKEDTFYDKLALYFPPLMSFAALKKSIREKNELSSKVNNPNKRLKI